ncbi:CR3L4 protein, partial [Polypterus senegalus]
MFGHAATTPEPSFTKSGMGRNKGKQSSIASGTAMLVMADAREELWSSLTSPEKHPGNEDRSEVHAGNVIDKPFKITHFIPCMYLGDDHLEPPWEKGDFPEDNGTFLFEPESMEEDFRMSVAGEGHVINPGIFWEGGGPCPAACAFVFEETDSDFLKGKGEASEAPLTPKEGKEGREMADRDVNKLIKTDRSPPKVATPSSVPKNYNSQKPPRDPSEHVPTADRLIGSRPAGKQNEEVSIPLAKFINSFDVQELEKLIEPVQGVFQMLAAIKKIVGDLGETAEAPIRKEMDSENQNVFFGQQEEEVLADSTFLGGEHPFSFEVLYEEHGKTMEEWALNGHCNLHKTESEEVLNVIINPNDVYNSSQALESPSESDSGISEDPQSDSPPHSDTGQLKPGELYQVVYDIGNFNGMKAQEAANAVDIISIELDQWNPQMLISDACIVNELPSITLNTTEKISLPDLTKEFQSSADLLVCPDLQLTEEEQRLLNQEGVSLPNNLPLTKAEERILKKVRRKIRNKQSAQDSRRRKKEYIDALESRSLLSQLRRLQSLIKQTATKAAQTSTCIMIIIFSLALILFPSYGPFSSAPAVTDEAYKPTGVISRNILTDPESLRISASDEDIIGRPSFSSSNASKLEDTVLSNISFIKSVNTVENSRKENLSERVVNSEVPVETEDKNNSHLLENNEDSNQLAKNLKEQSSNNMDSVKLVHADEM